VIDPKNTNPPTRNGNGALPNTNTMWGIGAAGVVAILVALYAFNQAGTLSVTEKPSTSIGMSNNPVPVTPVPAVVPTPGSPVTPAPEDQR
jgi:hypothetical protein